MKRHSINRPAVVIFDFDGTTVDSMENFARIASRVMPKYFDVDRKTAHRLYMESSGNPFFQQLEELFPGDPSNAAAAKEFESEKLERYFDEPLFDDTIETLGYLREIGIKTAVSSNNFQHLVDKFVADKSIAFDLVLGFKENFAKGADHFAFVERHFGVGKDQMVFVGDSMKDAEKAADYGIAFIAKEGIFTKDEFGRSFPDVRVISKLSELKEIFSREPLVHDS